MAGLYNARESLSSEKNSVKRSPEANLSSFKFNFLPKAVELVSVSSRAMTTTGTGVADFAVFGLNTSVLVSSKLLGVPLAACNASRHAAGDVCVACDTVAAGVIERPASLLVIASTPDMVVMEKDRVHAGGGEGLRILIWHVKP